MARHPYEDILNRERPVSARARMSRVDRAAQFAPFAALTGYDGVIRETARLTDTRTELEEQEKEILDRKLNRLIQMGAEGPEVPITCFVPDERKSGGAYQTITGKIARVRLHSRAVQLADGREIPLEDIVAIGDIRDEDWAE